MNYGVYSKIVFKKEWIKFVVIKIYFLRSKGVFSVIYRYILRYIVRFNDLRIKYL